MLSDEGPAVFCKPRENLSNLFVRQVLQHLPDEAHITVRQFALDDIDVRERNVIVGKILRVMGN